MTRAGLLRLFGLTAAHLTAGESGAAAPDVPWVACDRSSYRPGQSAVLVVWRGSPRSVRIDRVAHGTSGELAAHPVADRRVTDDLAAHPLAGLRVTDDLPLNGAVRFRFRVGDWPSGLYTACVSSAAGDVHAPFVVRPPRLGQSRVAVVLPTNTWQAYNHLDVDGDGVGDTWYASSSVRSVDLTRPYLDRGVPPHFSGYDRGFLRWLALRGHDVDMLGDDDLDRVASGDRLARLYDLVVFPGHEEYVTTHAFDVVERYYELGGGLLFLSANNFFYRVERHGSRIVRSGRWRDLGRPEARFIGVQYVDWNRGVHRNKPFVVAGAGRVPWLFAGTGLADGMRFGNYGIEIDARCDASPPGVRVAARIPDAFGPGKTAEMAYHETPRGARVFAAGVMNFGGSALLPGVRTMLDNLWAHMTRR